MRPYIFAVLGALVPALATPTGSVAVVERADSGALYGTAGVPTCYGIQVKTGAYHLGAAACAIAKCSSAWLEQLFKVTEGTVDNAATVEVTTWDKNLTKHTNTLGYGDGVRDGNDNDNKAFFMGLLDMAVSKVGDQDLKAGTLVNSDNDDFNKNAGAYALTFLTGQKAVTETIPSDAATFWNDMIVHANSSPLTVRMNGICTGINSGQDYVVYNFDTTDQEVTLFDVKNVDTIVLGVATLSNCSDYVYHLENYAIYTG